MQNSDIEQPKLLWLKIALPMLVLVLSVFSAWWLIIHKTEADEARAKKVKHEPPTVEVVTAKQKALRMTVPSQGLVMPKIEIALVPEVSGKVVKTHPHFAPGGFFKKGELLLAVDARDYEFAVVRAEAAVAEAKKEWLREREEAAQAESEWQALGSGKAADYVLHIPQLKEREAKLASAQADLAAAKLQVARCRLIAPFNGWVRDNRVLPGQYLREKEPVAAIYADDSAEVRLPVAPDQLGLLALPSASNASKGPDVTLTVQLGDATRQYQGKIVRVSSDLDSKDALVYAVAEIPQAFTSQDGQPPLMPGLFVKAEIAGIERFDLLSLPKTALFGGNKVFSVGHDDRLQLHEVQLLRHDGNQILITKGISNGDRVVISGVDLPVAGMKIKIKPN